MIDVVMVTSGNILKLASVPLNSSTYESHKVLHSTYNLLKYLTIKNIYKQISNILFDSGCIHTPFVTQIYFLFLSNLHTRLYAIPAQKWLYSSLIKPIRADKIEYIKKHDLFGQENWNFWK